MRYWWEIERAKRLDWPGDLIESHRQNLQRFMDDYRDMEADEAIEEFK